MLKIDTDVKITIVNDKCEVIVGKSKNELLDTSIFNVVKPSLQNKVRDFCDHFLKGRNKGDYIEYPIIYDGGELKWLGLNLTTMNKPAAENVVIGDRKSVV